MTKKVKFTVAIGLFCIALLSSTSVLHAQDLGTLNLKRQKITNVGMMALGTWAIGNMVSGGVLSLNRQGTVGYFHQMNFLWNTFNLALAASGLYQSIAEEALTLSLVESVEAQHKIERLLLLNSGLDLSYIMGGFYLMERSRRASPQSERYLGYGRSLILQGGFLLVFDLSLYALLQHHGQALMPLLSNISIGPNGLGLVIRL
jgi:hypothetical protein